MAEVRLSTKNQITLPREAREALQIKPGDKLVVVVRGDRVIALQKRKSYRAAIPGLKKAPKKLNLAKWKGRSGDTFAKLGYSSADKFIDDVRG